MVRSKDELLASIHTKLGEDTSDEAIALIEDISDSFDDLTTRLNDAGDWKQKYEENDAMWRDKYQTRFYEPSGSDPVDDVFREMDKEEPDKPKVLTFEELFKTE